MIVGPRQAFCTDETCRVLIFDPSLLDGGLSNPQIIELSENPE
jgi:hypothetical protein